MNKLGSALMAMAAFMLALGLAAVANATPLNLNLLLPDLLSSTIDVTYNATSDAFSASGFSLELDDDGVLPNVQLDAPGLFVIGATIDASENLQAGGTLSITGKITSLGYVSGTLLTGNLTDFGFAGDAAGIVFEFTFAVSGGDLASSYAGQPGGVILSTALNSFSGFGSDFDNLFFGISGTGSGISDTAPIPEPSTGLLVLSGLALLGSRAASRRRQ
jgi:hypothetical protein